MRDGTMVAEKGAHESSPDATSREAFEILFRCHQRSVYGWILRIVRNPSAAEDLTIETFWRIYRAMHRFDANRGFEPWARLIATRISIDWLRAQRPETPMPDEFFTGMHSGTQADPAIVAEIRCKVALAFRRLPAKLSAAAALAVVEGLAHKEVAAALGISVPAVKLRVFRALRILRNDLRNQGITP